MFPICQQLYTLGVEMDFTRNGDFTWRVSDCEELVGEVNHTLSCELTFLVSETFATNQLH